jgi:selenocysteine lyase/cysteine desulfurase
MSSVALSIDQAAQHFSAAQAAYLDTAAVGLPPRRVSEALHALVDRWSRGEISAPEFDPFVNAARAAFARIIGVPVYGVTVGSAVSSLVGLVAANLPVGSEVVCAEEEFTSVLFPFLVRQKAGEIRIKLCPLRALVDSIDERTTLVAVSAVQSADGRLFDADALVQACQHFGARTLVDATQAAGWLPLDGSRFDYVVAGTYKWLLSPKGTAFMSIRSDLVPALRPLSAGWYAGEDIWSSTYGAPLRLASSARRFDVSPAWFMWVGAALALELIESVGVASIHAHNVRLATAFLERLDRPAAGSAIVSVAGEGVGEALRAAGIVASRRAGATRLGFHLYNTNEQAIAAADIIRELKR